MIQNQPGTPDPSLPGQPAPGAPGAPVLDPNATPTPEQLAAEQAEAEKGFEAGFGKVNKAYKPETDTDPDSTAAPANTDAAKPNEPAAKPAAAAAPPAPPVESPELKAIADRLRSVEGRVGGVVDKLDRALASATAKSNPAGTPGAGPSQTQIQSALANSADMDKLIAEYPDFAPVAAELKAIRAELGKQQPGKTVDLDAVRQEFEQRLTDYKESQVIASKHANWEETVASPPFIDWMLAGGPSRDEYVRMNAKETPPEKAQSIINSWAFSHPDWWAEKGVLIFSTKAADSIKMLDKYTASKAAAPSTTDPKQQQQLRNKDRLESALTPDSAGNADLGKSDDEAFRSGFNRAAKRHSSPNHRI